MVGSVRRSVVAALAVGVVFAASLVTGNAARSDASTDTTPPALAGLVISPTTVDTSNGPVTISVEAHVTDDTGLSIGGRVGLSQIVVTGPGGQQTATAYLSQAQRVSGTALDGVYDTTLVLPWHAEPGNWNASVTLIDIAANTRTLTASDLAGAGLPSHITQTGPGDTTPPALVALAVAPSSVDTSLAPATIVLNARVTDDLSGVSDGIGRAASQIVLRGPTGTHHARATIDQSARVQGDALDGTYSVQVTLPRWSEQGTWTVESVTLVDEVGNVAVVSAPNVTFNQTGIGDIVPPRFRSFSMSTTNVDVTKAPAGIAIQTRLTDDRSGLADGVNNSPSEVVFDSPSGRQEIVAFLGLAQRAAGNALDGTYNQTLSVPAHAAPGTWTLRLGFAIDQAGNSTVMHAADWTAAGFPATFTVVSDAPPDTGPTLPPDPSTSSTTFVGQTTTTADPNATTTTTLDPNATTTTFFGAPTTTTTTTVDPNATTTTATTTVDPNATTTTATTATTVDPNGTTTTTVDPNAPTTSTSVGPDATTTTTGSDGSTTTETDAGSTTSTSTVGGLGGTTTTTAPRVGPNGRPAKGGDGYWFVTATGEVTGFGGAQIANSAAAMSHERAVAIVATSTGNGYWVATANGDVRPFGDARSHGSMKGYVLARPIVGMAATPSGKGYWLVATDGGIFSFGDARFYGSTGNIKLNRPIVGMTASKTGKGYRFVASDGGIFSFGDARFYGSTGNIRLNRPITGMSASASGKGYWLVARDGGIFGFGDARFYGSTGNIKLIQPIVGMASSPSGKGYWFVAADGGIFSFGDTRFYGSLANRPASAPRVVAMAAHAH